jgi:hypothetical protein
MADEGIAVVSPTREKNVELSYTKWLEKITERCTLTLLCIKDRTDRIQESDWDILKVLHGVWYNGEIPFYQTITIPDTRQAKQASLFDKIMRDNANVSDNFDDARDKMIDGREFVEPVKETKKKKKK